MSNMFVFNIFVLHYKLQEKFKLKQLIQLIAKSYQPEVDNIILTNSAYMYTSKNKMFMLNFRSLIFK